MAESKEQRLQRLVASLGNLTSSQINWIDKVVQQFAKPKKFVRNQNSTLISQQVLDDLGDTLRIHHCFSREPFSKDKFEYALERIAMDCGIKAVLAPRGNPGYDIEIEGQRISLKTEASRAIKSDTLHISKFMELGGGKWGSNPKDLIGLREQFFEHTTQYQRILVLRKLPDIASGPHYELVEIPMVLLRESRNGVFEMKLNSTQKGTKPGYCYVKDLAGKLKFALYFDGGGERKLQIKSLDKQHCEVHADWQFVV